MKKSFLFAIFILGLGFAYSQEHATCADAIAVTTSSYGPIIPKGWADSSLCVPNDENMYFGKKHKVVWFSFVVPYDTTLTFQIVPENKTDDFDFMLFKADRGDFCQKEKERKIKPIRTNFAKPTEYNQGITGLSIRGKEEMVPPGYHSSYSTPVDVKKGEWYYLAVDNYASSNEGFTLKLFLRFNAKTTSDKSFIDAMPVKVSHIVPLSSSNFFVHVLDSSNHPIKASLIIDGVKKDSSIKVDTADYSLVVKPYQTVKIRANAQGHMPYQSTYSVTGDTSSATFWIRLEPIKAAQKITLNDIQFRGGSSTILPSSKPALDYVLQFLLGNPNVKVIIKGYVNDPESIGKGSYDQDLSAQRADAVKEYLSAHGVKKSRMNSIGYGNTKMLYPNPVNEDQREANRRVEIEIQ